MPEAGSSMNARSAKTLPVAIVPSVETESESNARPGKLYLHRRRRPETRKWQTCSTTFVWITSLAFSPSSARSCLAASFGRDGSSPPSIALSSASSASAPRNSASSRPTCFASPFTPATWLLGASNRDLPAPFSPNSLAPKKNKHHFGNGPAMIGPDTAGDHPFLQWAHWTSCRSTLRAPACVFTATEFAL